MSHCGNGMPNEQKRKQLLADQAENFTEKPQGSVTVG